MTNENSTATSTSTSGLNDEYYGMNNTTLAYQNGVSPNSAIALCYNYTSGGYTDWYLPARFEMANANLIPVRRTLSQNAGAPILSSWSAFSSFLQFAQYWTSTVPNGNAYACYIGGAVYSNNSSWVTPMHGSPLETEVVGANNTPYYYVRPVRRF